MNTLKSSLSSPFMRLYIALVVLITITITTYTYTSYTQYVSGVTQVASVTLNHTSMIQTKGQHIEAVESFSESLKGEAKWFALSGVIKWLVLVILSGGLVAVLRWIIQGGNRKVA